MHRPISVLFTHKHKDSLPMHKGDYKHFGLIVLKTKLKIISKSTLKRKKEKDKIGQRRLSEKVLRLFPVGDC